MLRSNLVQLPQLVFNWHITEQCNYSCHYCFAKWEDSSEIWRDASSSRVLLKELSQWPSIQQFSNFANTARINFAGGEPMLLGKNLYAYLQQAKHYGFDTSIITNGSYLAGKAFMANSIDMVGISIDSFDHENNSLIGRVNCKRISLSKDELLRSLQEWKSVNPNIVIKFNVVVNRYNWQSYIVQELLNMNPTKIKVFRQLPFRGQPGITDKMFSDFLHSNDCVRNSAVVVEDIDDIVNSYLMIDPSGRFFVNGSKNGYTYSESIYDAGLQTALKSVTFSIEKFKSRYHESNFEEVA